MNGGESLVSTLIDNGVKYIFGVPGESYLSVLEAIRAKNNALRFINTRHESGASFAADAYGRLTSRPGVAFVTRGPGATNASIGIHTARQDSNPLVMFVGQVPTDQLGLESFQEINYSEMFGQVAKAVIEPIKAEDVSSATEEALRISMEGRPGPVIVPLPEDVGFGEVKNKLEIEPVDRATILAEVELINSAVEMIECSKYPVIIAGEMINFERCNDLLEKFASQIGAGVIAGFRRQGVIDSNYSGYFGHFGLALNDYQNEFWSDVDLVIGIGTRLDGATSLDFSLVRESQSLIQVFPSQEGLINNKPNIPICADSKPTIIALSEKLSDQAPSSRMEWREKINRIYRDWTKPENNPSIGNVDLAAIASKMSDLLPSNSIMTCDAGNFSTWFQRHGSYTHSKAQAGPAVGAMGYSVPAAFGAKIAYPEHTVVAIAGDGGFMMTGQELISAVENNLPIIVIVCDNSAYGTIAMHQYVHYGENNQYGTKIKSPDFAAAARGWGARASTVRKTDEFEPVFRNALSSTEPTLIHIVTDLRDLSGTGLKME
tara:strand:+ start:674 stop:2311 length:1638 start_codon:yes stop_codon:yes gene_type:complete